MNTGAWKPIVHGGHKVWNTTRYLSTGMIFFKDIHVQSQLAIRYFLRQGKLRSTAINVQKESCKLSNPHFKKKKIRKLYSSGSTCKEIFVYLEL